MILKFPGSSQKKIEEIYSETGSYYNKRKITVPLGSLLTELLEIDYDNINSWVNEHFSEFDADKIDLGACPDFQALSENVKFLLIFGSKLRFLNQRVCSQHGRKTDDYFSDIKRTISFIKSTVDCKKDSEQYFSFFFKYALNIYQPNSLYESKNDLNILNYLFPIALCCANNNLSQQSPEELYELLSEAECDKSRVQNIIDTIPQNTIYSEIATKIYEHFWCKETGKYRVAIPKSLDAVANIFSESEELRIKLIEMVYEYECVLLDRLFSFRWLHEYIGLCTLECYRKGYPICKCIECGKYFVRTSNSRRLCGNPTCASNNKKKAAQQRKREINISDHNILSAVDKALCYSKTGKTTAVRNNNAYINEFGITEDLSKLIVRNLQCELIQNYRADNKRYKKEIHAATNNREQMLSLYNQWLSMIKKRYSHQYVIECYRASYISDECSNLPFSLDYYQISNWEKIITTKHNIM